MTIKNLVQMLGRLELFIPMNLCQIGSWFVNLGEAGYLQDTNQKRCCSTDAS